MIAIHTPAKVIKGNMAEQIDNWNNEHILQKKANKRNIILLGVPAVSMFPGALCPVEPVS